MPCSLLPNSLPSLSNALLPKSTLGFTCQPPFSHSLDGCSPSHWLLPKAPAPPFCSAETEIRLCCLPVKMTEHTPDNAAHSTAWAGPSSLFSSHSLLRLSCLFPNSSAYLLYPVSSLYESFFFPHQTFFLPPPIHLISCLLACRSGPRLLSLRRLQWPPRQIEVLLISIWSTLNAIVLYVALCVTDWWIQTINPRGKNLFWFCSLYIQCLEHVRHSTNTCWINE